MEECGQARQKPLRVTTEPFFILPIKKQPVGRSCLHPSNHMIRTILLQLLLVAASFATDPKSTASRTDNDIKPPIAIPFTLKEPGYVTLVIEDAGGHRVRNLISETAFPAGKQVAYWDGFDDLELDTDAATHAVYHVPGKLVTPGTYKVRGLVRPKIDILYEMTPYTEGNPPWHTEDRSSQWLTNHTPPNAVLFVPAGAAPVREGKPTSQGGQMLVGSYVAEGGSGLAWLDLDGTKLFGQMWLGGVWTGASHLARDMGDKPVPGVYAYAGAGWKGDKYNDNKPELRLHELVILSNKNAAPRDKRMGTGEDRPVLTPTFKVPQAPKGPNNVDVAGASKNTNPLSGLAVYNGLLAAAMNGNDQILFVDAAAHKTIGLAKLEKPGGLAFDRKGRLLAISGTKLVRFTLPNPLKADDSGDITLPKPEVVIENGLEEPQQITIDASGQILISDWGKSHQVKVFSGEGKFVRAIGVAGTPAVGLYDPQHMNHPNGISVDDKQRLWVAEMDKMPKRVSVWTLDGKLVKAFYGPQAYGGGGWMDQEDKSRFYYSDEGGGMELKLDWEKGTSVPVAIYHRPELDPIPMRAPSPQTPLHIGGRTYLTNAYNTNPTGGARTAGLWLLENGVAKAVAMFGSYKAYRGDVPVEFTTDAFRARMPEGVNVEKDDLFFAWSDANGDGKMQPEEITFIKPASEKGNGQVGGVSVMPDLSFVIASVGNQALRFTPVKFTDQGVPVYDADHGQVIATGVQRTASSGGGQALTFKNGWSVLTTAPKPYNNSCIAGVRGNEPMWSYPSLWPGLHASHHSAMPEFPGELIGTTRLLGNPVTPQGSDAGELWAINGNKGNVYFFTADGLFVATLFKDSRTAAWNAPEAKRGMSCADLSLQEESFWPTLSQTNDGKIYLGGNGSILHVEGLEGVRRLPDSEIKVDSAMLKTAQEAFVKNESLRNAASKPCELSVALRTSPPVVDGKLDDWKGASWALIDKRMMLVGNWGHKMVNTEAALAIAGDRLYVAFQTDDPKLANTGESLQNLFKTGGALDLMLGTNPNADPSRKQAVAGDLRLLVTRVKNATVAVLYRPVVPGTKTEPVQFASPLRTIRFDRVDNVSDKVVFANSVVTNEKDKTQSGVFEFSIPLEVLGLNPGAGQSIRGDIGLLRGNGVQTLQRIYWSNKATGIVSDIPSEAELSPQYWGRFDFKKQP